MRGGTDALVAFALHFGVRSDKVMNRLAVSAFAMTPQLASMHECLTLAGCVESGGSCCCCAVLLLERAEMFVGDVFPGPEA